MSAAVLTIGTELTRGEIHNTNASWLAAQLSAQGMSVQIMEVIPDDRALIVETLRRLTETNTLLISTGGLGPTTDDLTSVCVAEALGVGMFRDTRSEEHIRKIFAKYNRTPSPSNFKQADFPESCEVLSNAWGTAPGFKAQLNSATACFLPGVPREMRAMYAEHIQPLVESLIETPCAQVRIKTFGAPESSVNDRLKGVEEEFGVEIGYRASFPEIEVKALAQAATKAQAETKAQAAAQEMQNRLGDLCYGTGDTTLSEAVGALLREKGWTLGLAESCTGGLVAQLFTTRSCSDYFLGGVVSYSNPIKEALLNVPKQVLETHGAVSEAVACAMVEGARKALCCDVALALTGIAGPSGGTEDKPVGLVHYAVSTPQRTVALHKIFHGDRNQVQRRAAFAGMDLIRRLVSGLPIPE